MGYAVSAETYAEETKHNLLRFPGAGSSIYRCPVPKNRTVVFRQSSLGSRRFPRPGERRRDEKVSGGWGVCALKELSKSFAAAKRKATVPHLRRQVIPERSFLISRY